MTVGCDNHCRLYSSVNVQTAMFARNTCAAVSGLMFTMDGYCVPVHCWFQGENLDRENDHKRCSNTDMASCGTDAPIIHLPQLSMQSNQEVETVAIHCGESECGSLFSDLNWVLIHNSSYCPGDGFIYSIRSPLGQSTIRRLGLIHMSDAWKAHMLAHYEKKRPARRPRYSPAAVQVMQKKMESEKNASRLRYFEKIKTSQPRDRQQAVLPHPSPQSIDHQSPPTARQTHNQPLPN